MKLVDKDSSNARGEKCAQIAITIEQNLIAFVANISTRVIAQKLEGEQKKNNGQGIESLFIALGLIFSSNSLDNACYVGYLTRKSNHRKSYVAYRS